MDHRGWITEDGSARMGQQGMAGEGKAMDSGRTIRCRLTQVCDLVPADADVRSGAG